MTMERMREKMGEVRPAAMRERRDIEWLVNWALEKQGLGRVLLGKVGGGGSFGVKVDSSAYSNDGKWVSDDAQVIAEALHAMGSDERTAEAAGLVVHYGQVGTQPDWGESGSGTWQLVRRNNGTGKAIRRFQDQRNGRGPLGFQWEWVGHTERDLDRLMLEWLAWHAALVDLRDTVNSKLKTYLATGPATPESPWDEPKRMIHHADGRSVEA